MIFFTFKVFILYTCHLYLARHLLYIPFGYLTWLWYRWPIEIDGLPIKHDDFPWLCGYGSIPINTIFRGMNIHLPAILMFTRGTRLWHTAIYKMHTHTDTVPVQSASSAVPRGVPRDMSLNAARRLRAELGKLATWGRGIFSWIHHGMFFFLPLVGYIIYKWNEI